MHIAHMQQLQYELNARVAVSKMVVLPRCLYVLQNSMCDIKMNTFQELNSFLIKLIWTGRRSKVRLDILKLDPVEGGLCLPGMQLYYMAGLL